MHNLHNKTNTPEFHDFNSRCRCKSFNGKGIDTPHQASSTPAPLLRGSSIFLLGVDVINTGICSLFGLLRVDVIDLSTLSGLSNKILGDIVNALHTW